MTEEVDNINLKYLSDIIQKNLLSILLFSILLSLISFTSSFFFDRSYKSEAIIISSSNLGQSSGLDGVSDLLGLGGSSSSKKVVEAIAILQSRDFISNFLFKYGLEDYILGKSSLDVNKLKPDVDYSSNNNFDKKEIDGLTARFKKRFISIDQSDQDGLIVLSLATKKAEDSQIILNLIIEELEFTMKNRYLNDKQNIIFSLEKILSESPDNNTKKIIQDIYNIEKRSLISGKVKSNLIFEIIDAPHLPGGYHYPNRLRFIIFGFVFGFLLSYLYFFRKQIIQ